MLDIYLIFLSFFSDFKFAIYPPSMIAAGSVGAAANGLLGPDWVNNMDLIDELQKITTIDVVSTSFMFTHNVFFINNK